MKKHFNYKHALLLSLLFLTFQTYAQTSLSGYITYEISTVASGASAHILELNIGRFFDFL